MKGLSKEVIKKYGSALNLFSEQYNRMFVTGIDFLREGELEENSENLPVLVLKMRGNWYAEPVEPPTKGNFGWFASGNFLEMEIDGEAIEIAIYDRQETPEQYEKYSR